MTTPTRGVTPYVGVWIETLLAAASKLDTRVTPYVGVWIETLRLTSDAEHTGVTPYVGVWIETFPSLGISAAISCHSLCGSVD